MSFASLETGGENEPLADINMIPLIDVMLVLLVIFIVTAPLLTHSVAIDLPRADSAPLKSMPASVELSIDEKGQWFWNGKVIGKDELGKYLKEAAAHNPRTELRLAADRQTPYETIQRVMSLAAKEGLSRIGFISLPQGE